MTATPKLVIGASGFLGSHVTRRLIARGESVRVMLRPTSSTVGIDDLRVHRFYGDIFDEAAVASAIDGCDVVYYCVVDTRAWLRDPAPLIRTNVFGLRRVLDIAASADLRKFVFTSTIGTIGIRRDRPATEDDPNDWSELGGGYIRSRVEAENLVLQCAREGRLPAVAMSANTYGPGDWQPTPHGSLVAAAARGRMPLYPKTLATESVGIEDAAEALILAAERGRVGERYIVSESYMEMQDVLTLAARAAGARPPRVGLPMPVTNAMARVGDVAARLMGRDLLLSTTSLRLLDIMSPMDHTKAVRELGWQPRPTSESIEQAARFFTVR